MRMLVTVVLLGLMVVPASANLLTNGSFEDQNLNGWVRKDRAQANLWDFPGGEAQDGNVAARFVEGFFSGDRAFGTLTQMATFDTPFTGDLTVSGWVKRYVIDGNGALQPGWGWAAAAIYVDGEHGVDPATAVPANPSADDTWHYFEETIPVVGISQVDVAVAWGLSGAGTTEFKQFDVVLFDGLTLVPEPSALVLLGLGVLPLLRRRRA